MPKLLQLKNSNKLRHDKEHIRTETAVSGNELPYLYLK